MTNPPTSKRDGFTLFLGAACAVLAVLTLLLARQNVSLKAKLSAAANAPPPGGLKVGDTLSAFDVVDVAGSHTQVALDGHKQTVLLVFSSTCGACRETIPVWNRILAKGVPSGVQVVAIQTDFKITDESNGATALAVPDLRFPVYGSAEPQGALMSKFPAIPAAALVDPTGVVKAVWFGVPTEVQASELEHAIAG